uniref:Reelin domain-containing protein n=1 Tax=Timema genevievae TaxID=629358 RepID=A0A7R9PHF6_TIMGE|nr:unnamed protein product [Timema genevievae]
MSRSKLCLALLVAVLPLLAQCFPDGAPIDACVKQRKNQPHHGQAKPQTGPRPYSIIATSETYSPGAEIAVTIQGLQGATFRGFFLQARDVETDEWIGTWDAAENTSGLPECSAITHADNRDKLQATLVWTAPAQGSGNVYFTRGANNNNNNTTSVVNMSSLGMSMRSSVHEQLEKARRLEVVSRTRFLQDIQEWLAFAIHVYGSTIHTYNLLLFFPPPSLAMGQLPFQQPTSHMYACMFLSKFADFSEDR